MTSHIHVPGPDDVFVVTVTTTDGAAVAARLVDDGHRVAVTGPSVTPLLGLLHSHGSGSAGATIAIVADLSDPAQMLSVLDRVGERLGPVTVVSDPAGALGCLPWHTERIEFDRTADDGRLAA